MSAFYNDRQGYIFEPVVQSPSRLNGAGIATVLLDGVGDNRLPTFQNLDFHVERPIKMGHVRFNPSLDIFNVANSNTVLALAAHAELGDCEQHQPDRGSSRRSVRHPHDLVNFRVRA